MGISKLTFALTALASASMAQSLAGLWDATVQYDNLRVPFRIEFAGLGSDLRASFFNGDERVTSTSGKRDGDSVSFQFADYATELKASLVDGALRGTYGGRRGGIHEFEARPHRDAAQAAHGPAIAGVWDVPTESGKGERAWHLIVRQLDGETSAAILRVDGDTGALTGAYEGGRYILSHFDGARPLVAEISLKADGNLALTLRSPRQAAKELVAVPAAQARAQGLPQPEEPAEHTVWKDANEPFRFRFPDLDGHIVSNADARFQDRVVIVSIGGSWCPNCHDEAPFLVDLYRKYHALGLEIVGLDFEEADQLESKARPRAFVAKYGIPYPFLLAGEPKDLQSEITQAENLNCWPTTFFLDRTGHVRAIHAGFAAAASGDFHAQLKHEVTSLVEQLLAAPASETAMRK
jgi:peroxiredoxin